MLCEGACRRPFRSGEKVYAETTRVVVIDERGEHLTEVHTYYCDACYVQRMTALYEVEVLVNG